MTVRLIARDDAPTLAPKIRDALGGGADLVWDSEGRLRDVRSYDWTPARALPILASIGVAPTRTGWTMETP